MSKSNILLSVNNLSVDFFTEDGQVGAVQNVSFEIDKGKLVRVERLVLKGIERLDADRVRRQMLTRPSSLYAAVRVLPSWRVIEVCRPRRS